MKKLLLFLSLCGVVGLEALTATQAMKIHNITIPQSGPLAGSLDLRGLGITTLGKGFLYYCGAQSIDLSNNGITTLSQEDISWLTGSNVLKLNLSGNPLKFDTVGILKNYLQCYYRSFGSYPCQITITGSNNVNQVLGGVNNSDQKYRATGPECKAFDFQ